jgi:membrane associated rhomboid family serine protease
VKRALWLASGVIVWALHFAVAYGYTGLACARGWSESVPWVVGISTVIAAVAAAALLLGGLRRRGQFEPALGAGISGFALLAILWEGASILVVPACA